MMSPVSPSSQSNGRADIGQDGAGVLGNLPRRRPQRASARRAAARGAGEQVKVSAVDAAARTPATPKRVPPKAAPSKTTGARAKPKTRTVSPKRPRAIAEEVPRQGFESEEERATGAVAPPGGAEFLGTAAEIVSELTKASFAGGERLLRDVLSRLPR
jgi:hypothetical protein